MNFIINKEEFLALTSAWKDPAKLNNHSPSDHVLYNALRGHDLKRGFSPIKSQRKLNNGAQEWEGFTTAKNNLAWEIRKPVESAYDTPARKAIKALDYEDRIKALNAKFGITFTPELLETLRGLL